MGAIETKNQCYFLTINCVNVVCILRFLFLCVLCVKLHLTHNATDKTCMSVCPLIDGI